MSLRMRDVCVVLLTALVFTTVALALADERRLSMFVGWATAALGVVIIIDSLARLSRINRRRSR